MNWAEQWLNRSQWLKDKYLKERYLVAEAVLHALSDPSPRVDLPLPYADMDEFIRALLDLEKIAGKNLFHPQQPNATPIWRTWLNLSHPLRHPRPPASERLGDTGARRCPLPSC